MAQAYTDKSDCAKSQQEQVLRVERDKNVSSEEGKSTVVTSGNTERARYGGYEHETPIKNSDVSTNEIKNEGDTSMDDDKSKTDLGVRKRSEVSDKDAEIARLKIKLGEEKLKNSSLTGELKEIKNVLGTNSKHDIISDLQKKNKHLKAKIKSMTSQQREFDNKHKKSVEEVEKLKKERERNKEQLADYDKKSNELHSQIEEYERKISSSQHQIETMGADLHEKDGQISLLLRASGNTVTSDTAEENEILRDQNSALTDKIEDLKRQVASLEDQNDICHQEFEEERREKRSHERLNRVLLEKLRVERMEREDLQRLAEERLQEAERAQAVIDVFQTMVENAQAGLQVVHAIIPDVEADELLQEARRAQAVNGVARMMVENALGGLQVVDPNLPDEEHSNNDL